MIDKRLGEIEPTPTPEITSFTATAATITAGASTTLSWTTMNAAAVTLDGDAMTSMSVTVSPEHDDLHTFLAGHRGRADLRDAKALAAFLRGCGESCWNADGRR